MTWPKRILISDIDGTLLDDGRASEGLGALRYQLEKHRDEVALVYATGRSIASTMDLVEANILPEPNAVAPSIGTEIWFPEWRQADDTYERIINQSWYREVVVETAKQIPGLVLQPEENQTPLKVSFVVTGARKVIDLSTLLKAKGVSTKIIYSCGKYLDVLPARAGKRAAVEYLSRILDVPARHILTSGDSGNDLDMLTNPATANVLVANAEDEMLAIRRSGHLYHAESPFAAGVSEGAAAFGFWPEA